MHKRTLAQKFLLPGLLLLAMAACGRQRQVVIVSTNDIHSAIDAFPNLASLVEKQRAEHPGNVLLVDAGDRWTGNPYVDRAPSKYKPVVDLMNELGYDLATFGNHEWDAGVDTLATRVCGAKFEHILANVAFREDFPFIRQYKILTVGGLDILFLGLVTTADEGHPVGMVENFGKTKFLSTEATVEKFYPWRPTTDVFVALSHLGFEEDSLLAVNYPHFDLIIGGHSHTVIPEGLDINGVVVTQTGNKLRHAGITTITYRGKKIRSIDNRLVMLDTIPPSPKFREMVDRIKQEPSLKATVATIDRTADKIGLLNLFSDIVRRQTGADFAFYNVGGMRLDSLRAGDIALSDIYSAEPFDNKPVVVEMTGEQIAEFILNKFNSTGKESHTLDLYPSGMEYRIVTDAGGNATDVFLKHNFYPERGKTYKVAMSDYVNGAYDFSGRGQGVRTGTPIADFVINYLKANPSVSVNNTSRVVIE